MTSCMGKGNNNQFLLFFFSSSSSETYHIHRLSNWEARCVTSSARTTGSNRSASSVAPGAPTALYLPSRTVAATAKSSVVVAHAIHRRLLRAHPRVVRAPSPSSEDGSGAGRRGRSSPSSVAPPAAAAFATTRMMLRGSRRCPGTLRNGGRDMLSVGATELEFVVAHLSSLLALS